VSIQLYANLLPTESVFCIVIMFKLSVSLIKLYYWLG